MGCCVSSTKPPASQKHHHSQVGAHPVRSESHENRASHPLSEEETVKEVLSETPKPKPQQDLQPAGKPVFEAVKDDIGDDKSIDVDDRTEKFHSPVNAAAENEVSELSEVYSLSESVSTTTTKRDDDEEVRQRVHRSSPARPLHRNRVRGRDPAAKRERPVGRSPTRRSDQSPSTTNSGTVRSVQAREPLPRRGLRAAETPPNRRGPPGEPSARRSRSPATRVDSGPNRSVVGRSPSARRTNKSPSRVRSAPSETYTPQTEQQTTNDNGTEGKQQPTTTSPTTNESLENPLVSLECFIFL